jgi:autonomous glycyl radical cofactor GrcA
MTGDEILQSLLNMSSAERELEMCILSPGSDFREGELVPISRIGKMKISEQNTDGDPEYYAKAGDENDRDVLTILY